MAGQPVASPPEDRFRRGVPCLMELTFLRSSQREGSKVHSYVTKATGDRGSFQRSTREVGIQHTSIYIADMHYDF